LLRKGSLVSSGASTSSTRVAIRSISVVAVLALLVVGLPLLPGATAAPAELEPVEVGVPGWEVRAGTPAGTRGARPSPSAASGWSVTEAIPADELVMVGAEWGGDPSVLTEMRTLVDGEWGDWLELALPDGGPDPGTAEAERTQPVTEPVWIAGAEAFQLRTTAPPDDLTVPALEADGDLDALAAPPRFAAGADASASRPTIVTRAQWGADESLRRGTPSYAAATRFAVVHHTAGTNAYECSQSASIVNGVYRWHAINMGWDDIGYNFLVDKCGTIFEGRAGGVDRSVIGAHTGGWNSAAIGVSALGNFDAPGVTATAATRAAIADLLAWRFGLHGIDPLGTATVTGGGFGTSRYPAGTTLTIPTIVGHSRLGHTACPGVNFVAFVRDGDLARTVQARLVPPPAEPRAPMPRGATPLVGDFNGDGVTNTGYRAGQEFVLRMTDGRLVRFVWGRASDRPIVGDWNGNGVDTIGLIRGNEWLLRNSNSRGDVQLRFRYGRSSDTFLTGDFNGDGRDTPGVRRGWEWILRTQPGAGPADVRFGYGKPTDTPVVGDFNGNGVTTIGVVRGNQWLLRDANSRGPTTRDFLYGRSTDTPVTGDWNGSGADGVGVVRNGAWYLRHDASRGARDLLLEWSAR
jgi:hypothetical protein